MAYSDDNKVSIMNGYNHIVRQALRKRADIICNNTYNNYHRELGVIISGKKEIFVLKEHDHLWFDANTYNNFHLFLNNVIIIQIEFR